MYKFYVQSVLTILMLHTIQILSMQQPNEITLLECAQDHVRGKSLLQQNEYFTNLLRPSFKLLQKRIDELSYVPTFNTNSSAGNLNCLSSELHFEIIRYCGNCPQLKVVSKYLGEMVKAAKNLSMRNFLLTSRIQRCEDLKMLFTMDIPVLLVEAKDDDFFQNKYKCRMGNYTSKMVAISPYAEGFYFNAGCYRNDNSIDDHNDFMQYSSQNKDLLFFPDHKKREDLILVYELGCERLSEQCEAQSIQCNRFMNSPLITAVLYGNSDKVIELLTYYRDKFDYTYHIYDAIRVAIKYPSNNPEIMNILVKALKDYHRGNGFACDMRLCHYPHMLYLADKYKNWQAFDELTINDPHNVNNNFYGVPYIDSIIKDRILSEEAIRRFRKNCYPQSVVPKGRKNCSIQ